MAEAMSEELVTPWWELSGMERKLAKYDQCEEPGDCDHDHDNAIEYFREQELNELRQRAETAERELAEMRSALTVGAELIDRLAFDDECDYDHNDYCQAHNLHARPCPHPLGRQYVEAWRAVQAEQQPEDGDRG